MLNLGRRRNSVAERAPGAGDSRLRSCSVSAVWRATRLHFEYSAKPRREAFKRKRVDPNDFEPSCQFTTLIPARRATLESRENNGEGELRENWRTTVVRRQRVFAPEPLLCEGSSFLGRRARDSREGGSDKEGTDQYRAIHAEVISLSTVSGGSRVAWRGMAWRALSSLSLSLSLSIPCFIVSNVCSLFALFFPPSRVPLFLPNSPYRFALHLRSTACVASRSDPLPT